MKDALGSIKSAPMFSSLGHLRFPFIAGSAALLLLGLLWQTWDRVSVGLEEVVLGLLVGGLGSVVLYALMRAFAVRSN